MNFEESEVANASGLRICCPIPYLDRAMGGPVVGLANLATGLVDRGLRLSVPFVQLPTDGPPIALPSSVKVIPLTGRRAMGYRHAPKLAASLHHLAAESDVIHSNGLWASTSYHGASAARRAALPHVISVHGMLAAAALRFRGWKKLPMAWWFQDRALREAACLHVTSEKERREVRDYGLRNPVAVIPMPVRCAEATPEAARDLASRAGDDRVVLFLGRLHPVKGLDRLIEAWAGLGTKVTGWRLVIAGPDEGDHGRKLREKVDAAGLSDDVLFVGEVDEVQKAALMRRADLFVLPSDFENFGMVVAEALAWGLPVIASTGTPWEMLGSSGAGWWIPPTVPDLARALCDAIAMPARLLKEMGARAVSLAGHYSVEQVAGQFDHLYAWLRGRGGRPDYVEA